MITPEEVNARFKPVADAFYADEYEKSSKLALEFAHWVNARLAEEAKDEKAPSEAVKDPFGTSGLPSDQMPSATPEVKK
jgi:hypothetical protein